jgi:hypothetical protein
MKLENRDLVREFLKQVKEQYPEYSSDALKDAIETPWLFLRENIAGDVLPLIRFRYLGSFQVYHKGVSAYLRNLEQDRFANRVNNKCYLKEKKILEDYIKRQNEK